MNLTYNFNKDKLMNIKYHKMVITLLLIVSSIPPIRSSNPMVFYAGMFLVTIVSIGILFFNSKPNINGYVIWASLITMFILLSLLWTINLDNSLRYSWKFVINILFFVYISFLIRSKNDIYVLLKIYILSNLIMVLYLLFFIDFSTLGEMRIGIGENLGEEWNANTIGMNLSLSCYAIIVVLTKEKNNFKKLLYYTGLILFTFVMLFSGSRKALFIFLFSIGLFSVFFTKKSGKLKRFIISTLVFIIVIYLTLNIPILYDVLGSRIDNLISNLTGENSNEASLTTRKSMIESGMDFFKQQPFMGYGIGNFKEMYENTTGVFNYAHNNYIELLVGIGIIGTVIYYSGLVFIICKSISRKNELSTFALISALTIIILDIGLVSYTARYIHLFICLSFSALSISNNKFTDRG